MTTQHRTPDGYCTGPMFDSLAKPCVPPACPQLLTHPFARLAQPTRLAVHYTAPVLVIVDLDDSHVVSVHVIDESVELDWSYAARATTLEDGVTDAPAALAHRARAIAEQAEWPSWEHGR